MRDLMSQIRSATPEAAQFLARGRLRSTLLRFVFFSFPFINELA